MVFENLTYNMTALQNVRNMFDLVTYANNETESMLITLFLITFAFGLFMIIKSRAEFDESILVSCFISFVVGIILTYMKLINILLPLGFFLAVAGILLYMIFKD